MSALPSQSVAAGHTSTPASESWLRTALFGSVNELRALIDGGLDPNTKTEKGTTLLMAAVLDPEKVRLLIARGANVKARGASGADALTVAKWRVLHIQSRKTAVPHQCTPFLVVRSARLLYPGRKGSF